MEARSLAAVNSLAANPPQYPEKPNEERQEPLVLYISRVPGTRDVILSPFKPQVKNVTAEDVASCLYYVHLEMPSAGLSAQPARGDEASRSSQDSSRPQTIPRKPLPESARPLTPQSPPDDSHLQPPLSPADNPSPGSPGPGREPALAALPSQPSGDSGLALDCGPADVPPRPSPGLQMGMPARKPLAPGAATDLLAPASEKALPSLPQNCPAPERGDQGPDYFSSRSPARSPSPVTNRRPSLAGTPFTLTLIRRDRSSGNQWNVGRVSSRQLDTPWTGDNQTLLSAPQPLSASPAIDIEIETSGYAKFRRLPPRKTSDAGVEAALAATTEDAASRTGVGVFSRQVVMGYTKSWTASLKEKLHRMEQAGRARINRGRSGSVVSIDSAVPWFPAGDEQQSLRPRGYIFSSPWNGKCEFRTCYGGRSVECLHTLHDGEAAAYNPLVADRCGGPRPVSELRFNLPSSELLGEHARIARDQWRGNFGKLLRPGQDDDDDDDDDVVSPFEVNVGSEPAGGGNRGKRAKLGKLIVYGEGLKMLDLVVAANMGVWWGAWERTF